MIRFLIIFICLFTFQKDKTVIHWNDTYKLSWDDFKGKPKPDSGAVAETASGISFGFSITKTNTEVVGFSTEINTYFYPKDSWFYAEKASVYILEHEQLHFDITELFARKFRKEISKLKISNAIKSELKALYKKNVIALGMFQKRYDAETNHSEIPEIQKQWQHDIKAELDKLSKYKSIKYTCDSR